MFPFLQTLDAVRNILEGFEVGRDQVRVGLISFSTDVRVQFNFNKYTSKDEILAELPNTWRERSSTYTYKALEAANTELFSRKNGAS